MNPDSASRTLWWVGLAVVAGLCFMFFTAGQASVRAHLGGSPQCLAAIKDAERDDYMNDHYIWDADQHSWRPKTWTERILE
jgi:hypothetical protein